MNFLAFKAAVAARFAQMTTDHPVLYRADVAGDVLWDTYLESFPEGTNPIYRKQDEALSNASIDELNKLLEDMQ